MKHKTITFICLLSILISPSAQSQNKKESAESLYTRGMAVFKVDPEASFGLLNRAAKQGHVKSMIRLGHCSETGTGTHVNLKKALQWYKRAAKAGSSPAIVRIGEIHEQGAKGIRPDYAIAIEWYEKGVSNQSLKACSGLARIYASSTDTSFHDAEKAVRFASVLVKRNRENPEGYDLLAAAYARNHEFTRALQAATEAVSLSPLDEAAERRSRREGYQAGRPWPPIASKEWMLESAEKENMWAMLRLADDYDDILSDQQDPVLARHWYKKAAENGNIDALLRLGHMCFRGTGGKVSYDQAFWCFREAAKAKKAEAYMPLGRMYVGGKGTSINLETAMMWYKRADEAGISANKAQYSALKKYGEKLGEQDPEELYEEAQLIAANQSPDQNGKVPTFSKKTTRVFPRYWLAAEQGHTGAMKEVADMYFYGKRYFDREKKLKNGAGGISQSYRKALEFYEALNRKGIAVPELEACTELALQARKEWQERKRKMERDAANAKRRKG